MSFVQDTIEHLYTLNWKFPVLLYVKCMCRFILKSNQPSFTRSASRYRKCPLHIRRALLFSAPVLSVMESLGFGGKYLKE